MTVRQLEARNNLNNIPHMLRNLATEFESGREAIPRTLLVVAIEGGDKPPLFYQFGEEGSRLEEVGALAVCMNQMMQTELVPIDE